MEDLVEKLDFRRYFIFKENGPYDIDHKVYNFQTTFTDHQYIFSPLQTEIIKKNRNILEVFSQNKQREVNNQLILQETRETVTEILTRND